MVVDAVGKIYVTLALKTREGGKFRRVLVQRLVQVNNIFAANEDIFAARHKMHWNVDLVKPSKVIRRLGALVNSQILSE